MEPLIHKNLCGAVLENENGVQRAIIAAWMEENGGSLRPSFVVLTVDGRGVPQKITLPDPNCDWDFTSESCLLLGLRVAT